LNEAYYHKVLLSKISHSKQLCGQQNRVGRHSLSLTHFRGFSG